MFSTRFILASTSITRRRMLKNVGLEFTAVAAKLDEEKMLSQLKHLSAAEAAMKLAEAKAFSVAADFKGKLIIAADQLLECAAVRPLKPQTIAQARTLLRSCRGKSVFLSSAGVAVRGKSAIWRTCQTTRVKFNDFSAADLENYLAVAADEAVGTAGAVQLEGKGIALIEEIDGDFFAALGFPLLPFLQFLHSAAADDA